MGNWLVGGSSARPSGGSLGESSAGPSWRSSDGFGGWPDLPAVPAHKLKDFIHAKLKPSEECLKLIDQDVDAISDFLRSSELPVRGVAKGGSYGRETVLRGYSDGTLVLFMGRYRSFRDQKQNQRELLSVIEQRLKQHKKYSKSVSLEQTLEVLLSVHGQEISLQVLPAFDPPCFGEDSTSWIYRDLKSSMDQVRAAPGEFAVCFTRLQQRFFQPYPRRVKELILLVKHWYQECQEKWMTSSPPRFPYALELLTVYAWEQGCQDEDFDIAEGVRTVLRLIKQSSELCVYWIVNYSFEDVTVRNTLLCQLRSQSLTLTPASWKVFGDLLMLTQSTSHVCIPQPLQKALDRSQPTSLFVTPSHLLDTFIKDLLQPNEKFLEQIRKAVNIICEFLKNNCFKDSSTKVLKAVKGGSTAKGTALKNGSDADIVVFLSPLKSYDSQNKERTLFVQEIQRQLEVFRKTQELEVKFEPSKWTAPRVLSFTLKSRSLNESVDFDVLPAYDALGQLHPDFTSRPEAYKDLIALCKSSGIKGGEFSTCFTELQRDFIKPRPTKLKSLIRLVKHWYKQCEKKIKSKASLPPKYALELLTVYAWEQGSGMEDFDTAEGFRTILDLVIKYQQLCIFWTVNYNFKDEPIRTFLLTQIQKKRPVILDPADPTGDVGGGDRWHWHLLAKEANEWLSSLCFELQSGDSWKRVQPWKVPVVQTPGSCGAHIYSTVGI
ncbi:2'-5'-oligoadenylate synthase 2-like [Chionomys nivalis]|uniref:2'-5'-oligoadenylate synthase 2-like n=1 Tax=Chionomys nivalis TaxID=269649 RepID=UPI002598715D|nr:2'-5'-oligoadenylate synthase 2-like [Chionomys nivalis]